MRFADVGDQSEIGLCDRAQQRDLSAMTRTHLHDAEFRRTVHRQQRQRHSDVVVEISLRDRYAVFPFQRPADQFFGRRFSVAARYADDRNGKIPAPLSGHVTQSQTGIGNDQRRQRIIFRNAFRHHSRNPFFRQFGQKIMRIEILAFQCHKQIACADKTGIYRNAVKRCVGSHFAAVYPAVEVSKSRFHGSTF